MDLGRVTPVDSGGGFGYEGFMKGARSMTAGVQGRRAIGSLVALGVAASLWGGEAMRESAPSVRKAPLGRNGRPTDPLLERLVNSAPIKAGRDDSGFVDPLLMPKPNVVTLDPQVQRQWKRETERQRNWLIENATRIANPDADAAGAGGGETGRALPTLRNGPEPESPASIRYLHARDAALANETRRGMKPEPGGLAGRMEGLDPAVMLDEPDAGEGRPLDTRRITAHGGDPAAAAARLSSVATMTGASPREFGAGEAIDSTGLSQARKTAMEERNAAFETLLATPVPSAQPGASGLGPSSRDSAASALTVVGLETRRTPASRARQFETMLAGGDASPGALGTHGSMTRGLPTPSAASGQGRGTGLPGLDRSPGQAMALPMPVQVPRAPERRFQAQPAILEIPRFHP